jgi:pimeloyl-ACP methyl ester carboxylesterase
MNLVDLGYKVYAIDFPGHGQSKGFKCSWKDAVEAILITQRLKGKFDIVLGHSFGGGMLVNASALSHLTTEFEDFLDAKKYVLLASALSANVPIRIFSQLTGLGKSGKVPLQEKIVIDANIDFDKMSARFLQTNYPTDSKFLLIHGTKDKIVKIHESRDFAKMGEKVKLIELDNIGHLNIIYSDKIIDIINENL